MRTVAVIQARMGSSRLPGKVLKPLAGKPVLWHIIHRLRKCRLVDTIAIATSTNPKDDPLVEFGDQEGVPVVRGSEENVLARYLLAAEQLNADVVVRITGDVPLIDPGFVDRMVEPILSGQSDYCMGDPEVPCIHEGVDPFTVRALRKLSVEAGDDASAREHVTTYFKTHPDFVRVTRVAAEEGHQFSGARISVDTPSDLRFLEEIYARLKAAPGEVDLREVVTLLRGEPQLLEINAHVQRKGASTGSHRILVRCDGDSQLGLGHVVRCLALADELRDAHGFGVVFAMTRGAVGFDMVRESGYPVESPADGAEEGQWLEDLIQRLRPVALVLDVRNTLSRQRVETWRKEGLLIVAIDDPSERRLAADLAFYPPIPQIQRMDWTGFSGELHVGWDWVVLRKQFAQPAPPKQNAHPLVLVAMGGSDPAGLTLKAVHALDMLEEKFKTIVVVGAAFCHSQALDKMLNRSRRRFEIRRNVTEMAAVMAEADLAVASFSVTAYELAAVGVPGIYLCLSEDHAESASTFVEAGIGISLGQHAAVSEQQLALTVQEFLKDWNRRREMASRAGELADGRGAQRIAGVLAQNLETKKARNKVWKKHQVAVFDSVIESRAIPNLDNNIRD